MRARADERTDGMPVRNGGVSREVRGAKLRRDRGPRRVMLTFRVIDLLENAPYEGLIAFDRRSGSRIDVARSQAHHICRCRWPLRRSLELVCPFLSRFLEHPARDRRNTAPTTEAREDGCASVAFFWRAAIHGGARRRRV